MTIRNIFIGLASFAAFGLAGCSSSLKYDLSQSPAIAMEKAGLSTSPTDKEIIRTTEVGVAFTSSKAPSIGEGYDWNSMGGTAIPFLQLDKRFKPAIPTPPVEELVYSTLSGLLASENIGATRYDVGAVMNGLVVDVRRFEMNFDDGAGSAENRTAYMDCLVKVMQNGSAAYERTVTKQRSANLGTGGASAAGSFLGLGGLAAGQASDAEKEKTEVPKLFGDLLSEMVKELREDTRAMEAIHKAAR